MIYGEVEDENDTQLESKPKPQISLRHRSLGTGEAGDDISIISI